MTLILAIACQDGLVIASDSQGTEETAPSELHRVRFPCQKLWCVGNSIVWGGSGDTSLIQRVKMKSESIPSSDLQKPIAVLRTTLRRAVVQTVKEAADMSVGFPGRPNPLDAAFLFVGETAGRRWILEVLSDGRDTRYDENRGFHAIGSANIFAQMAHAMLLHYGVTNLGISQSEKIAYRTLDTAIQTAAAGIDYPICMYRVKDGVVHKLGDEEVDEARDFVGLWKETERESLQSLY